MKHDTNHYFLFLLLVVLSLQRRIAVRQASSYFLFYNLCILYIIRYRFLRFTTGKLKPIDQFGNCVNKTTDTNNHNLLI